MLSSTLYLCLLPLSEVKLFSFVRRLYLLFDGREHYSREYYNTAEQIPGERTGKPIVFLRLSILEGRGVPITIRKMPFAQLVIGSPGAGKSTYCDGMHQFLTAIERKCSVVNLDPANDRTSYRASLDIRDLVTLDEVMEMEELGPNGGTLYALEELEGNVEWLEEGLKGLGG